MCCTTIALHWTWTPLDQKATQVDKIEVNASKI